MMLIIIFQHKTHGSSEGAPAACVLTIKETISNAVNLATVAQTWHWQVI